ncbi:MAG: hypothetical protein KME30_31300 [Iphinoe sp. HA4291-MV1]|jgi:hypothetical protein|nr:hypothetical protein [Iphinoe sp. HA4291-MV1]
MNIKPKPESFAVIVGFQHLLFPSTVPKYYYLPYGNHTHTCFSLTVLVVPVATIVTTGATVATPIPLP